MSDYEIELPFPPSLNTYRAAVRGRLITTKRGREYATKAMEAIMDQHFDYKQLSGRLDVTLILHPPCKRRRDIDNYCKAPLDALTKTVFWLDDEQVDHLHVIRGEKVKGGKLIVKVDLIKESKIT
jgi:crossover junction endodeoxyribonuclease RusA